MPQRPAGHGRRARRRRDRDHRRGRPFPLRQPRLRAHLGLHARGGDRRDPIHPAPGRREQQPYYRSVQEVIEGGQVWHGNLTARRKDGQLYHQEATISPVRATSRARSATTSRSSRTSPTACAAQEQIWRLGPPRCPDGPAQPHPVRGPAGAGRSSRPGRERPAGGPSCSSTSTSSRTSTTRSGTITAATSFWLWCHRRLRARAPGTSDTVARLGGDEFAVIQTGLHGARAPPASWARGSWCALAEPYAVGGQEGARQRQRRDHRLPRRRVRGAQRLL